MFHTVYKHCWCFQVVVKFIKKAKVLKEGWLQDNEMGLVPLEVSLLARLSHHNVVAVSMVVINLHK